MKKLSKETRQLAKDLGLSEIDAYMMDLKANLFIECSKAINNSKMTHLEIAELLKTSRARITRLANKGETTVTIDMLIKIITFLRDEEVFEFKKSA